MLVLFCSLSLILFLWWLYRRPTLLDANPRNCSECYGALFQKNETQYSVYDIHRRIEACTRRDYVTTNNLKGPEYVERQRSYICSNCVRKKQQDASLLKENVQILQNDKSDEEHIFVPVPFSSHFTTTEYKYASGGSKGNAKHKDTVAFLKRVKVARRVADIHRQVRYNLRNRLNTGERNVWNLACTVEKDIRDLCAREANRTQTSSNTSRKERHHYDSVAFPVGININNCAAHFTPNPSHQSLMLRSDDVVSFDIGVQIEGVIIDSAFTWTCNPIFQPLLDACREGAETGLKHAGVDVYTNDIGRAVQEVVESFEVTYASGLVRPVKVIRALCGHCIGDYQIHAKNKIVPSFYHPFNRSRMEANEFFAIEPFASTGQGKFVCGSEEEISHFMVEKGALKRIDQLHPSPTESTESFKQTKLLMHHISNTYHTLAFSPRSLYYHKQFSESNMKILCDKLVKQLGIVGAHPPLYDVRGSHTAQVEHTIAVLEDRVEILSRGEDY